LRVRATLLLGHEYGLAHVVQNIKQYPILAVSTKTKQNLIVVSDACPQATKPSASAGLSQMKIQPA
jgi:hypothetical protein